MSVVAGPVRSLPPAPVEPGSRRTNGLRVALSSRVYLPACSIVVVAAVLIAIGWANGWGGADFAGSMSALRVVVIGPITLAIIGVLLIVERVRPAQRRPLFARGYRQDLLYTVLNATVTVPLVTGLTLSFSEVVRQSLPWLVLARIGTLPSWGAIALIFVAMDGCNWSAHLANHRVRMLWRFHELHHSQEDMNVLTVFRTHPLIHVSYLIALVPGIVLVANGVLPTALLVIYGGVVAFAHSNTNLGFGPLGRIFVSPNYHRIHHQLNGPQDVNLGFALTIWDQLAHRAVFPTAETVRTDTGLAGRPLIVEQSTTRPRHFRVFAAQLVAPFRPLKQWADVPADRAGD
ncbi:MAG: sterol desaturase family protein [Acidimicrobiales bacterium]|jgi:sterol desaturase/sphingolipid hydroxylase (fatty acid hydroxylase superfamily)